MQLNKNFCTYTQNTNKYIIYKYKKNFVSSIINNNKLYLRSVSTKNYYQVGIKMQNINCKL